MVISEVLNEEGNGFGDGGNGESRQVEVKLLESRPAPGAALFAAASGMNEEEKNNLLKELRELKLRNPTGG